MQHHGLFTKTRSHSLRRAVGAVVLVVGLTATACNGNKGGETTCGEFNKMSGGDQKAAVAAYLEETGDPTSGLAVTGARTVVKLFCSTVGESDDPISDADFR